MSEKTYTYGFQSLDQTDMDLVCRILQSPFLTCGPAVSQFEQAICDYTSARYCVAVSSATAALHLTMLALGIGPGDEVVTSPITFLASANCVLYVGGSVRFADVESDTANIAIDALRHQITPRTKAIIPVHYAGQSCDMEAIHALAREHGLYVIEDAAHAIGSNYKDTKVGSCRFSDMTVFSFHPVKTITTAEGGAITTNDESLYRKLLALRSHGTYKEGQMKDNWEYEMRTLGYNYRLSDIHAALGVSQMKKLESFKRRRREIVDYYDRTLGLPHLTEREYSEACFHLYPILLENRDEFYAGAKAVGLHLQVHYIPVHTQPYYQSLGFRPGMYPRAEEYYSKTISLPLYPLLSDSDLEEITTRIKRIL